MNAFGHGKSKSFGTRQAQRVYQNCWTWVHGLLHVSHAPHLTMCSYIIRLRTSAAQQITYAITPCCMKHHEFIIYQKPALHWLVCHRFDVSCPQKAVLGIQQSEQVRTVTLKCGPFILQIAMDVWEHPKDGISPSLCLALSWSSYKFPV